ncbi:MAG: STAS domain-containing protein [Balneolaceae bacterium]|nr:STAS domain-containing protein [Balneolaceae bacterium]
MNYDIDEKFNCAIIQLKGNVMGGPHAEKFRDDLHSLIDQGKTNVVVDLSKVKFINSSGLGILIGGLTTMRNADGDLVICGADKKIRNLLMVTQLISVFDHYKTLDEAVESYQE